MGKGGRAAKVNEKNLPKYTFDEVKKHHTPMDAWVIHHNKVYDVSDWYEHPGGAVIFTHAGDDMTDIFTGFHAKGSTKALKPFLIGELDQQITEKTKKQMEFEQGYRALRLQFIKLGYFQSNKWFYAYKCISNLCILASAIAMVRMSDSYKVHLASALTLGMFWQQCGWLAHDFLHHQVFQNNRRHGDYFGLFWGNLMQGFSVSWWKNKHNGHHAVTNLHSTSPESQDGDPDIDTMPLLAWSLKQAQSLRQYHPDGKDSAFTKMAVKFQAFTYFPILLLARISWLNESFKAAMGVGAASENAKKEFERKGLAYPFLEPFLLICFHTWNFALSCNFGQWSLAYSMAYYFTAACSSGLFLALVFGVGHNGMAVYDAETRPNFWKLQVTTTRNIIGGHGIPQGFVDWFCGGLQYQVEHHLFPTMPRHHLPKAHKLVDSFCKEWNVSYHEADLIDGNREVVEHLQKVSDDFLTEMVREFPAM